MGGQTARSFDGVPIAWEADGEGSPLVLVHGITDDRTSWDTLVPLWTNRYRCIRLDLRGHGESGDAGDYSILALAADVAAVVESAGVTDPAIVGHSLGGMVATTFAASYPVAAAINVDQSVRVSEMVPMVHAIWRQISGPECGAVLTATFAPDIEPLSAQWQKHYAERFANARPEVVSAIWAAVKESSEQELDALVSGLLGSISAPYLAIHGSEPTPGYEDWLREHLPTSSVEVWGGQGHFVHLREPEKFAARVDAFVQEARA